MIKKCPFSTSNKLSASKIKIRFPPGADDFPDSFAIEDPRFCIFAPLIQNRDKFFPAYRQAGLAAIQTKPNDFKLCSVFCICWVSLLKRLNISLMPQ